MICKLLIIKTYRLGPGSQTFNIIFSKVNLQTNNFINLIILFGNYHQLINQILIVLDLTRLTITGPNWINVFMHNFCTELYFNYFILIEFCVLWILIKILSEMRWVIHCFTFIYLTKYIKIIKLGPFSHPPNTLLIFFYS